MLDRPLELVRRDELLGPVIAGLARRVKRALQDDQNDILDRLRSQGGWKEGVLPDARPSTRPATSSVKRDARRGGTRRIHFCRCVDRARRRTSTLRPRNWQAPSSAH